MNELKVMIFGSLLSIKLLPLVATPTVAIASVTISIRIWLLLWFSLLVLVLLLSLVAAETYIHTCTTYTNSNVPTDLGWLLVSTILIIGAIVSMRLLVLLSSM